MDFGITHFNIPAPVVPPPVPPMATAEENMADPIWRISNLYKIIIKSEIKGEENDLSKGKVIRFVPNWAQLRFIDRLHYRNIILKARQLGFCLDPETKVLTAALKWVCIKDLVPGGEVISVDENIPGGRGKARKMRTATVLAAVKVKRKAYRITLDDGRELICTGQHPWLSKKVGSVTDWRKIENNSKKKLTVGTSIRWVTKPWEENTEFEDGWFGGMLDGEGSMALPHSSGAEVSVSQVRGPVWDRLVNYLRSRGYNYRIEEDNTPERKGKFSNTPVPKLCISRMDEIFRLLGQTRPSRFMGRNFWEGKELPGKRNGGVGWSKIVSIEPLEEQTMIDLQTSTGTYIAEGFVSHNTTLIAIIWLDHALFNANVRCGIIAQDKEAVAIIFRDKVKFAYENLDEALRLTMPLKVGSAKELLFGHNNSSVRVGTSMRSSMIDRLHVSEFGKICAKYPAKAAEVITGSIPAVPLDGITIIESTAEGSEGEFYDMTQKAIKLFIKEKPLTNRDYQFHFFPWWAEPDYRMDKFGIEVTEEDEKYFKEVEEETGTTLDDEQKAWYVATRDSDFTGNPERMWQEYPSTAQEAFRASFEGKYYAKNMAILRKQGRILDIPVVGVPVNTFWDIGNSDGCAIWYHQQVGMEDRFIGYDEAHGEDLVFYAKMLQKRNYLWNYHFLPHDADHERLSTDNKSVEEQLNDLGVKDTVIVGRIDDITNGIQMVRKNLVTCFFDKSTDGDEAESGINRLSNYKKKWDTANGRWREDMPNKLDGNSEGADAFRQFAQAKEAGIIVIKGRKPIETGNRPAPDWR